MNSSKKIFCFTVCVIMLTLRPAISEDRSLILFSDYAVYKYDDASDKCYVEIFYNLLRNDLKFYPDSVGFSAIMDFKLVLGDSVGNPLDSVSWKAGSRIVSLSVLEDSDYLISDVFGDLFGPGSYIVTLSVTNDGNSGWNSFKLNVPSFSDSALAVSSIEWAYSIKPDSIGKLLKNGYCVLPNASGRFHQDDNVVYLYAETYNIDTSPGSDSAYNVTLEIYDSKGDLYKAISPVSYVKPGKSAVIATGFSIAAFEGGMYKMRLIAKDGDSEARTEKAFSVIPSVEKTRLRLMQAVLNDYPGANNIQNEEQAKKFRDAIVYIAAANELKLYDSLNLRGKENFRKEFWEARDTNPATIVNEYQMEHYRRLKYAEEHFSRHAGIIPGWKSDQGRVYILYGEPTDIERNMSSIETRSWEKWWYHGIEGGVYFIFVDYEDTDSYELIHSNKQNEIKDENWEDKIKMTVYQR
ncbi:MAG: GWxTD domain-containing protein [Candidatus Zixiibacteriota bacterium]|nr:MAG: GWxTD domain-containing protein [candidate division Zixibacteria bacterium]